MAKDPYTDDEYDDTYKEVHGDEPARDQYADDGTDDNFFPTGAGGRFGGLTPSGWGIWPTSNTPDAGYTDRDVSEGTQRETEPVATGESDEGSWWDEGLIGTIIVAGFVLFVIPEPATSALGIFLMGIGVVLWIIDWLL